VDDAEKVESAFGLRSYPNEKPRKGTLRSVGLKHGRWLDVVLMQRPLGSAKAHLRPAFGAPADPARNAREPRNGRQPSDGAFMAKLASGAANTGRTYWPLLTPSQRPREIP